MSPSLTQQLREIQTHAIKQGKVRASFLFDQKEASDLDIDTIYSLGVNGLLELKLIQPRFEHFHETLFSESMKSYDRTLQTIEVNAKLDVHIHDFLRMISPFFLLKPAHKALEWLIRRFRINELNVDAVVACILPYHSSSHFLTMIHVLRIPETNSMWSFLRQLKKNDVPLDTQTLVQRCIKDPSVFNFLCESIKSSAATNDVWKNLFAYYAAVVVRVIRDLPQVNESFLAAIIPYILHGLKQKYHPDYQLASYTLMIVLAASPTAGFKPDVLHSMISLVLSHANTPSHTTEALSCVACLLSQQQPSEKDSDPNTARLLSPKILHQMAFSATSWLDAIDQLSSSYDLDAFLSLLLRSWMAVLPTDPSALLFLQQLNPRWIPKDLFVPLFQSLMKGLQLETETSSISNTSSNTSSSSGKGKKKEKNTSEHRDAVNSSPTLLLMRTLARQRADLFDRFLSTLSDAAMLQTLVHQVLQQDTLLALHHPHQRVRSIAVQDLLARMDANDTDDLSTQLLSVLAHEEDHHVLLQLAQHARMADLAKHSASLRSALQQHLSTSTHTALCQAILEVLLNALSESTTTEIVDFLIATLHLWHLTDRRRSLFLTWQDALIASRHAAQKQLRRTHSSTLPLIHSLIPVIDDKTRETLASSDFAARKKHSRHRVYAAVLETLFVSLVSQLQQLLPSNEQASLVSQLMSVTGKAPLPMAWHLLTRLVATASSPVTLVTGMQYWQQQMTSLLSEDSSDVMVEKSDGMASLETTLHALVRHSPVKRAVLWRLHEAYALACMRRITQEERTQMHVCFETLLQQHSHCPTLLPCFIAMHLTQSFMSFMVDHLMMYPDSEAAYDLVALHLKHHPSPVAADHHGNALCETLVPLYGFLAVHQSARHPWLQSCFASLRKPSSSTPEACTAWSFLASVVRALNASVVVSDAYLQSLLDAHLVDALLAFIQTRVAYAPVCVLALIRLLPPGFKRYDAYFHLSRLPHPTSNPLVLAFAAKIEAADWQDPATFTTLSRLLKEEADKKSDSQQQPQSLMLSDTILSSLVMVEALPQQKRLLSLLLSLPSPAARAALDRLPFHSKVLLAEWHACHRALFETASSTKKTRAPEDATEEDRDATLEDWTTLIDVVLYHTQQRPADFYASPCIEMVMADLKALNALADTEQQQPTHPHFMDRARVEYLKQQLLGVLLALTPSSATPSLSLETVMEVLRTSTFAATHTAVLQTLAQLAAFVPEQVVHVLLPLFTFMGTHLARQDDAYHFQLLRKTLEALLPVIAAGAAAMTVSQLIRVFVDAWPHMPRHRRLYVFSTLIQTLSSTTRERDALSTVCALLLRRHARTVSWKSLVSADTSDSAIAFLLELCQQTPSAQEALSSLAFLHPDRLSLYENDEEMGVVSEEATFKYMYSVMLFVGRLLTDATLLHRVLDEKMTLSNTTPSDDAVFLTLLEVCLIVVAAADTQRLQQTEKKTAGKEAHTKSSVAMDTTPLPPVFFKGLCRVTEACLSCVTPFLSAPSFHAYLLRLVSHPTLSMKHRALGVLSARLRRTASSSSVDDRLVSLAEDLVALAAAQSAEDRDAWMTCQTALLCLEMLVTALGGRQRDRFVPLLGPLIAMGQQMAAEKLRAQQRTPVRITLLVCLSAWCLSLKQAMLPHLNATLTLVLSEMDMLMATETTETTAAVHKQTLLYQQSVLTTLHKIVSTLPQFVAKQQLIELVRRLTDADRWSLEAASLWVPIRTVMATRVSASLVLSVVDSVFSDDGENKRFVRLFGLLESALTAMSAETVVSQHAVITDLLKRLLSDTRRHCRRVSDIEKSAASAALLDAVMAYTLRLNETAFGPFFVALRQTLTGEETAMHQVRSLDDHDRITTFYMLTERLAVTLKGLFVPYMVPCVEAMMQQLVRYQSEPNSDMGWTSLMRTLHETARYDRTADGELRLCRADRITTVLLAPLMRQLEVEDAEMTKSQWASYETRMQQVWRPCLVQLAVTVHDDQVWKAMNQAALMRTQSAAWRVRYQALSLVKALYARLGEEFLILLPETIPFLAELMDDGHEEVEKLCQETVGVIEKHLGEPLQKYFK